MATIYCECGEPLVDDLDLGQVKVEDEEIPFRRASDYVACDACGAMRSVRSLRAEAVAEGELDPEDEEPLPPTISGALQEAADEALRAIQEMSGGAGDAWEGDYADVVLSALSDIHHEEDEEGSGGAGPAEDEASADGAVTGNGTLRTD